MGTALITGCSTGIGFAVALRLAAEGYDVVATMRNPDRDSGPLVTAAQEAGLQLRLRSLDVRDSGSVEAAFEGLDDLEVLVNNAGIISFGSTEPPWDPRRFSIQE